MITLGELQSIKWREGKIEEYDVIDILNKNSKYSIAGYEDKFILNEGSETPSQEDIDLAITEKKKEYENSKYILERSSKYPSIQEQLDMQYWDAVNGTKKWQEAVAKVKDDNPKPE